MMAQSIGSAISGTTYPSDDPELVAVEADYAAKEAALQSEIDNIESSHPGYDEYRYDLDMIGHDPHELAAYLSARLAGLHAGKRPGGAGAYLRGAVPADADRGSGGALPHRDPDGQRGQQLHGRGPLHTIYILNVTPHQPNHIFRGVGAVDAGPAGDVPGVPADAGQQPLIFGGGSADTSDSESLAGVEFVNGTRPGNQAVVDIAKSQVGNVGGQPYWSWYGFTSRVEWCACFVSWCYGQMGLTEPRFSACQAQGIPWFQSHGQWGGRDYANIAPGDAIFFDWDLDGRADHVGIVVGTDGSRVYTVEGNSGDACKIKSYSLTYECIKGYGLMNW